MGRNLDYIPALGNDRLTPFYDLLMRLFMREEAFRRQLIDQANLEPGQRVLDLGCGTASLAIRIKQAYPQVSVTGLDGDQQALAIAGAKARRAGVDLRLDQGMAYALPYPDGAFKRVLSSLVIHHLKSDQKRQTMVEVWRVLAPAGEFHIADFGPPHSIWGRFTRLWMAHFEEVGDNLNGRLPEMLHQAGFEAVEETATINTIFGSLILLRAR